jgi:hypothetical protein
MKKKKIIFIVMLIVAILVMILYINRKKDKIDNDTQDEEKIEELKYDVGATGDSDIYELQTDNYDGREILTVKASIKYKVAFAGMIKKTLPTMEEVDEILNENHPKENGIWVEQYSREKILEILENKEFFNSEYTISASGYIMLENENNANENDKKLQKALNSKKQYLISISSICYIVDDITGEILDYSFENMDKYQTYEYFEDENKDIIFITENKSNQLSEKEIVNSVLEWF